MPNDARTTAEKILARFDYTSSTVDFLRQLRDVGMIAEFYRETMDLATTKKIVEERNSRRGFLRADEGVCIEFYVLADGSIVEHHTQTNEVYASE